MTYLIEPEKDTQAEMNACVKGVVSPCCSTYCPLVDCCGLFWC